jgi:hypothetical protein
MTVGLDDMSGPTVISGVRNRYDLRVFALDHEERATNLARELGRLPGFWGGVFEGLKQG